MKTYSVKAKEIVPQWHVVDAADQSLGRVAAQVASLLRGKHRPNFTPHLDMRDFVVVVNAARVRITGNNKMRQKTYYRHSRYPGGLKETRLERMMSTHPTRVIEHAVRGMLPHNRLGAKLRRHLKVYAGPEHPHEAQVGGGHKPSAPVAPRKAPRKKKAKARVEEPVAVAEEQAPQATAVAEEERPPAESGAVVEEEKPSGEPTASAEEEQAPEQETTEEES
jgi:large subunit ribosomal protein L13